MDNKNVKYAVSSIFKVAFSNIVSLAAGVLAAFVLPKIMGIDDYGYYKIFTLYASYVGLAAIGITDGIYLKFAGTNYENIDRNLLRFFTKFYILFEFIVSLIFGIVCFFSFKGELRFIFLFLSFYLFANNLLGYYKIISQITYRFNELSIKNIVQSIFLILSVLVLWLTYRFCSFIPNYMIYIAIYVSIIALITLWYIFTYREITFGKVYAISNRKSLILELIKLGIPLLVANLCSSFILSIDRQFVSIYFDIETYAIYSFAYNMLALITTATSAISTVIYPIIKRNQSDNISEHYSKLVEVILIFVFMCTLIYYPLSIFIKWYLPKYIDSLEILMVIFPGLAINSAITIAIMNYYKHIGKVFNYFIRSAIILLLSIGANFIAYYSFGTTISISIASVIVMLFWYLIVDSYFIKNYKVKWIKNLLYLIVMSVVFYLISIIGNKLVGFCIYFLLFILTTFAFYYKDIKFIIKNFKKKEENN